MKTIKVIDLLNKIANKEIEDGTIFEVLGDFFYKLIVIDENLYCINTYSKQLQLVENKYIGRFINKKYEIVEIGNKIGNKIEDTPEEDKKIEKLDLSDWVEITSSEDCKPENLAKLFNKNACNFSNKINEIIDKVNGE